MGRLLTLLRKKGGFSPADLPGLALWLDASDLSTITHSSGAVSQWDDKSGNARHVVQATGSLQPVTGTRTINGVNALDFAVDQLKATAFSVAQNQPYEIHAVVKTDDTGAFQCAVGSNDNTRLLFAGGAYRLFAGLSANAGTADTNPHFYGGRFDGAASQIFLDGAVLATLNPGTTNLNGISIGAGGAGAPALDGLIGEVVVVFGTTDAAAREQLFAHWSAKWGVALA